MHTTAYSVVLQPDIAKPCDANDFNISSTVDLKLGVYVYQKVQIFETEKKTRFVFSLFLWQGNIAKILITLSDICRIWK